MPNWHIHTHPYSGTTHYQCVKITHSLSSHAFRKGQFKTFTAGVSEQLHIAQPSESYMGESSGDKGDIFYSSVLDSFQLFQHQLLTILIVSLFILNSHDGRLWRQRFNKLLLMTADWKFVYSIQNKAKHSYFHPN